MNVSAFLQTLPVMFYGMGGIFIVTAMIIVTVKGLGIAFDK